MTVVAIIGSCLQHSQSDVQALKDLSQVRQYHLYSEELGIVIVMLCSRDMAGRSQEWHDGEGNLRGIPGRWSIIRSFHREDSQCTIGSFMAT